MNIFIFALLIIQSLTQSGVHFNYYQNMEKCLDGVFTAKIWARSGVCVDATGGYRKFTFHSHDLINRKYDCDITCTVCTIDVNMTTGGCFFDGSSYYRIFDFSDTPPEVTSPTHIREDYFEIDDDLCDFVIYSQEFDIEEFLIAFGCIDSGIAGQYYYRKCTSSNTHGEITYYQDDSTCSSTNTTQVNKPNVCTEYQNNNVLLPYSPYFKLTCAQSAIPLQSRCFGHLYEDVAVCGGHGTCIENNICQCDYGYVGEECEMHTCNGMGNTNSSVCNGNGQCIDVDLCNCYEGYKAIGRDGKCVEKKTINSEAVKSILYINYIEKGNPCDNVKNVGYTISIIDECSRNSKYLYISGIIYTLQCNSICTFCSLSITSDPLECTIWNPIFEVIYTVNEIIDISNGISENSIRSEISSGDLTAMAYYNDSNCLSSTAIIKAYQLISYEFYCAVSSSIYECNGTSQAFQVTYNSRGCIASDLLQRQSINDIETNCNIELGQQKLICGPKNNYNYCNGTFENVPTVCSGNGICIGLDICNCNENYYGTFCEYTSCNNINSNDVNVCSNKGICIEYDLCVCISGYVNVNGDCLDEKEITILGEITHLYSDENCYFKLNEFYWSKSDNCYYHPATLVISIEGGYKLYFHNDNEYMILFEHLNCTGNILFHSIIGSTNEDCFYDPNVELYSKILYNSQQPKELYDSFPSGYFINYIYNSNDTCHDKDASLNPDAIILLRTDRCYNNYRYLCIEDKSFSGTYKLHTRFYLNMDECKSQLNVVAELHSNLNECLIEDLFPKYGSMGYIQCLPIIHCNGINSTDDTVCSMHGECHSGSCMCKNDALTNVPRYYGSNCEVDMFLIIGIVGSISLLGICVLIIIIIIVIICIITVKVASNKRENLKEKGDMEMEASEVINDSKDQQNEVIEDSSNEQQQSIETDDKM